MRESADARPTNPRLAIALTLVTACALAAGVACSGGGKGNPQVSTTGPTAASPVATRRPESGPRQFVQTPVASAQGRDAFAALWLASQRATYRVRYETSAESGERSDDYAVFNLPPYARVDTLAPGATEPTSQIIVGQDGSTFGCSFDAGKRTCGKIDAFSGPLPLAAGPIIFPADSSFSSISVAELDNQTIAGAPAQCFRVLPASTSGGAVADYCFSANAVPVYASGPSGIIVASELSTASAADFALPTP